MLVRPGRTKTRRFRLKVWCATPRIRWRGGLCAWAIGRQGAPRNPHKPASRRAPPRTNGRRPPSLQNRSPLDTQTNNFNTTYHRVLCPKTTTTLDSERERHRDGAATGQKPVDRFPAAQTSLTTKPRSHATPRDTTTILCARRPPRGSRSALLDKNCLRQRPSHSPLGAELGVPAAGISKNRMSDVEFDACVNPVKSQRRREVAPR